MAVSSGFAGVNFETLLISSSAATASSSSLSTPNHIWVFCKPARTRRNSLVKKNGWGSSSNPAIRCEIAASDVLVQTTDNSNSASSSSSRSSSLSALELLKTSAADRYTKERSSIVVIGLSVHTTPVEMREKLAIPEAEWPRAIGELCSLNHIEEAAVLSTCNRMEIYVVALSQHRGVKEVTEWMSKIAQGGFQRNGLTRAIVCSCV
ncbi:unnamed protein product [Ilex paraguariensis]|uniref:Glutamyl-tRNA reductase N-terminal domain-containing protein n=1 Tax=Ilex paraguariensis TaxID=185542 RepID=A0ABC8SLD9_9AQUA